MSVTVQEIYAKHSHEIMSAAQAGHSQVRVAVMPAMPKFAALEALADVPVECSISWRHFTIRPSVIAGRYEVVCDGIVVDSGPARLWETRPTAVLR